MTSIIQVKSFHILTLYIRVQINPKLSAQFLLEGIIIVLLDAVE